MAMRIHRENTYEPSVEEIVETIDAMQSYELIRPLLNKMLKEEQDQYRTHSRYLREQRRKVKPDKELLKYQQDCTRTSRASVVAIKRMMLPLDMLHKSVNEYHKVRGGQNEIKI